MSDFFRIAWLVVRKDLAVEARSWELVSTTVFFAVSCVLVFAFALVEDGRAVGNVAAGILWVAIAFSGTLALGRTFERERQTDTLRALMLAPADRPALYVGKLLGILVLMAVTEAVLVPLVGLFFQAPVGDRPLLLAALLIAGTIGYAAVGTLFAAMLVRARSRDVMLPILLYPITVPVIIAGVRGTAALFQETPNDGLAQFWLAMLLFFDVVFVTLALWTFEPLMTE
ncbi:MAG TPA: heme exporter protein CcmB [Vicinamibacterales bacterium]|nr:heme exporter protein CcmB [Vicinamibacterales bacterium]